ncbi:MAG: hypothetical protein CV087_22640 [Candidatus Brocadia sp. WS118]|nr:MAG: hypothetical protein CV087_22640 [Candidatus Brocadia sp. WS118]
MPALFLISGFSWSGVLFLFIRHRGSLTRKNQFTGLSLFPIKYFSGGPRLPKIAIVIRVPVLQLGYLRKMAEDYGSSISFFIDYFCCKFLFTNEEV